jgi:hypothetical protein
MPLSAEHRKILLDHLNEIAPDTFNEGEFSGWQFRTIDVVDGSTWMVAFRNSGTEGSEVLQFSFEGDALDGDGGVRDAWTDALNKAIFAWEARNNEDFAYDD